VCCLKYWDWALPAAYLKQHCAIRSCLQYALGVIATDRVPCPVLLEDIVEPGFTLNLHSDLKIVPKRPRARKCGVANRGRELKATTKPPKLR